MSPHCARHDHGVAGQVVERSMGMAKGDLLILRSTFNVKRSDYHISALMPATLVAENVQAHIAIAGIGAGK